jgi:hypothetical protein
MNHDSGYHDELTAHLAAQAAPQPHPERYCHGYTSNDPVMLTTVDGKQFSVEEWAKINATPSRKHPGPITMFAPRPWYKRINWAVLGAAVVLVAFWSAFYLAVHPTTPKP